MSSKKNDIKSFITFNLKDHSRDIVRFTSASCGVSRQIVNRYIKEMIDDGFIAAKGTTRKNYSLVEHSFDFEYHISPELQEDVVWRNDVAPLLNRAPKNILEICQYGLTEIINNAIDHSRGTTISVIVKITLAQIELSIIDDGIGIFNNIKQRFNLDDERHAILELAKGKLTTDPAHHTGEGIFFTSRVFDYFSIYSGSLYFAHTTSSDQDWLLENKKPAKMPNENPGTFVSMIIGTNSSRRLEQVFNKFADDQDGYGFTKTIVPVFLAMYGNENLVSRSQAKRLLARFERFKEVLLDFNGVTAIGQAFADEVFRVFRNQYPEVKLASINTNPEITRTIQRATENVV